MIKNPLLQQAMAKLTESVDNHDFFNRLLSAGVQTIYDKELFPQLTKGLPQSKDPVADTAHGIVGIMSQLVQKARNAPPPPAVVVQAGFGLLLDALDFEEQSGLITVDKSTLAEATSKYMEAVLPSVGLTPAKIAAVLAQVKQTASDPQKLARLHGAMGGA